MPSAYLLVYYIDPAGDRHVLLGHKNIIGVRLNGVRSRDQMIWNNAGQWAIPGGRAKSREAPAVAAMREFAEETAIDFRDPAVLAMYSGGFVPSTHRGAGFSVTYVRIVPGMAATLAGAITTNITNARPLDDELHEVRWFAKPDAAGQFGYAPIPPPAGTWLETQYNAATDPAVRDNKMRGPFDWFQEGLINLP